MLSALHPLSVYYDFLCIDKKNPEQICHVALIICELFSEMWIWSQFMRCLANFALKIPYFICFELVLSTFWRNFAHINNSWNKKKHWKIPPNSLAHNMLKCDFLSQYAIMKPLTCHNNNPNHFQFWWHSVAFGRFDVVLVRLPYSHLKIFHINRNHIMKIHALHKYLFRLIKSLFNEMRPKWMDERKKTTTVI